MSSLVLAPVAVLVMSIVGFVWNRPFGGLWR
jgi:hypothetical protein